MRRRWRFGIHGQFVTRDEWRPRVQHVRSLRRCSGAVQLTWIYSRWRLAIN